MFFVECSAKSHMCPICHGILKYRDSKMRIRKKEGGRKDHLMIRRFRCAHCHTYHNELPDCLVPYKHYEAEVISGVLDGIVTQDDLDSETYPSFTTMCRWLRWFKENLERMNGYLQMIERDLLGLDPDCLDSSDSLLQSIRKKYQNWLERVLRLVYNSGGSLVPIRW